MSEQRDDRGIRHRLFVTPRPAWPIAVARILLGFVLLAWSITLLVDVDVFLGSDAIVPSDAADRTFRWLPIESTGSAVAVLVLLIISSLAVIVGFRPTVFLLVSFALLVAVQRRNPEILNSGDLIMRDLTLLLALCPTGAALSIDRVRRFGRSALFTAADVAPWGLRLVQLQMVVVYFFAFWSKSGSSWRDGTAVSTALRLVDLQRFGQLDLLVDSIPLVAVLTWGTLAVELALATLLWVKRLRAGLIVVAILLHVSIDSLLLVGFFGPAMVAGLMTFLDGTAVDRQVTRWRERRLDEGSRRGQPEADLRPAAG